MTSASVAGRGGTWRDVPCAPRRDLMCASGCSKTSLYHTCFHRFKLLVSGFLSDRFPHVGAVTSGEKCDRRSSLASTRDTTIAVSRFLPCVTRGTTTSAPTVMLVIFCTAETERTALISTRRLNICLLE